MVLVEKLSQRRSLRLYNLLEIMQKKDISPDNGCNENEGGEMTYNDTEISSVLRFIEEAENYQGHFNGKDLALVLRLVFYAGIKKIDIPLIKYSDIYDTNFRAREKAVIGNREKILNCHVVAKFQEYMENLLDTNQIIDLDSAIFYRYKHIKYLDRDINAIDAIYSFNLIRDIGCYEYYIQCLKSFDACNIKSIDESDISYDRRRIGDASKKTADQFGMAESGLRRKIQGTMPTAGITDHEKYFTMWLDSMDRIEEMEIPQAYHEEFIAYVKKTVEDNLDIVKLIDFESHDYRKFREGIEQKYSSDDAIGWVENKLREKGIVIDMKTLQIKLMIDQSNHKTYSMLFRIFFKEYLASIGVKWDETIL